MLNKFSEKMTDKLGFTFIKGAVLGLVCAFLTMLIFAAAILLLNLDRAYSAPLATVAMAIGCFVASMYSAKKIGGKGYLIGLIVGVAVFLIITVISLAVNSTGLSMNTLFHFLIIVLASVIGGIVGVNKGKNKKYI